jgi:hypothetical protein
MTWLPILGFAWIFTACSPLVERSQPHASQAEEIMSGADIGQTFVPENDGLSGIQVFLSPKESGTGEIILHLRSDPQSLSDLTHSSLPIQSITLPGYYTFEFLPIQRSRGTYYSFFLEIRGTGSLNVGSAGGDVYLNGASYRGDEPQDSQLAFRLRYDQLLAALGWIREGTVWLGYALLGVFLFCLPGWGILCLVWTGWNEQSSAAKLGLAAGFSLVIYPLFVLFTDLLGLHLGRIYAWLPPLAGILLIVFKNRKMINRQAFRLIAWPKTSAHGLLYAALIILVFFIRFWSIRSIEAPMWGDSVQHTVIAQLFVDKNGLFSSWEPYAPYQSLTVQWAFSLYAALLTWIVGLPITQAVLVTGQLINGIAVLVLIPLAERLAPTNQSSRPKSWAGPVAVLIAGLLSSMPAFYLNWGRYSQLAGQAILPVAVWMVWETITPRTQDKPQAISDTSIWRINWTKSLLAAYSLVGMLLASYRLSFFYLTFVLVLLIGWGIPNLRLDGRKWLRVVFELVLVGLLAGLLLLPWGVRLLGSNLAGFVEAGVIFGSQLAQVQADYQTWLGLYGYLPEALTFLAVLGLAWSLARKNWMVASLGIWVLLLASIVATRLVHFPGANMMQSFAVLIALYIPASWIIGWLLDDSLSLLGRKFSPAAFKLFQIILAFVILGLGLWSAWSQRLIPQPAQYAMVTRPDLRALAWIRDHMPSTAIFLVEGFSVYNGASIVGSDAGWWIPLLAGRKNTIPPQYAIVNETPNQSDYSQEVIKLVTGLEASHGFSPQIIQRLCAFGVTDVYIGQGQGNVSSGRSTQLFSSQMLSSSGFFTLAYHQDRVFIFTLIPSACH